MDVEQARTEVAHLREQVSNRESNWHSALARADRLQPENNQLRAELARLNNENARLTAYNARFKPVPPGGEINDAAEQDARVMAMMSYGRW